MFYMLMEMWTFTHQHQHDTSKITPGHEEVLQQDGQQVQQEIPSADVIPARRDDAIEDTKAAILERTGPIVVHKADRRSLDPHIQEMLLFRERQRHEAQEMTV
mmetsp:Transcript_25484/g.82334  ORF Transcript_25484/g.82334 Transcript_25484/m.82334 type:complete len:103 (-) Transcript_25484:46-354(-)